MSNSFGERGRSRASRGLAEGFKMKRNGERRRAVFPTQKLSLQDQI